MKQARKPLSGERGVRASRTTNEAPEHDAMALARSDPQQQGEKLHSTSVGAASNVPIRRGSSQRQPGRSLSPGRVNGTEHAWCVEERD